MKRLFVNFMLVAVAAMAFTACQNETDGVNVTPEQDTITMTFVADAPESRTSVAIDGETATYSWSVDETGKLIDRVVFLQTQDVNTDVNTKYSKDTSSISEGVATFVTEFAKVDGATVYNYAAIFPAQSIYATSLSEVGVELAETQTLTEGNYDPNSDLMMSKLIEGVEAGNGHGGKLQFSRLAAIGRMNLKGINAGETINKVVITFEEEVVNGRVTIDFEGATASYAETGSHTITLNNGSIAALADGTPIFFTCFPGEYTGAYSVEVTTDKATYSTGNKSIVDDKALSFTAGNVTRFNLTVGNRVAGDTKTYTKITNANLADYSGTYLLVYEAGSVAFDGSLTTLDATNNNRAVEINNGTITGSYSASTFTIAKVGDGYSIQSASGKYIGRSATSNGLNSADSYSGDYLNTIENLVIKGKGGCMLKYNKANNQNRFRYFGSGQETVALYRQNGTGSDEEIELVQLATPKNLNAVANGNVVTVKWDAVENATNYDVTVVDGNTTNVNTNSATLTLDYEKEYTIEVVAKGGVGYTDSEAVSVEVTTGVKTGGETGGENTVSMNIYAKDGTVGTKTISWTSGDVTVTNNQAGATSAIRTSDSNHFRAYKGSELIIGVANGTISKVVITCESGQNNNGPTYVEAMKTSFENAGYTVTVNDLVVTVTGSAQQFMMNASAQTRLNKVEVTYTK